MTQNRQLIDDAKDKVLQNEKTILYNKQLISNNLSKSKSNEVSEMSQQQDMRSGPIE